MILLDYECDASWNGDPLYHLISYAGYTFVEKILEFNESLYQDGGNPYIISGNHQYNLIFVL